MNTLISICIPAYKQGALLERLLNSVFTQSFKDFEVIITDDSETDILLPVVNQWINDKRLRYYKNNKRLGTPENWNYALSLSRSNLIKFMHHDDWFSNQNCLQFFYDALAKNPQANLAFCQALACNLEGKTVFKHSASQSQIAALRQDYWPLQFGNFIGPPSSIIFRKDEGLAFDGRLKWVVDLDFYMQILSKNAQFVFISQPLVSVSIDGAHQVTRSIELDRALGVAEQLYLYQKFKKNDPLRFFSGSKKVFDMLGFPSMAELARINMLRKDEKRTIEEVLALIIASVLIKLKGNK